MGLPVALQVAGIRQVVAAAAARQLHDPAPVLVDQAEEPVPVPPTQADDHARIDDACSAYSRAARDVSSASFSNSSWDAKTDSPSGTTRTVPSKFSM